MSHAGNCQRRTKTSRSNSNQTGFPMSKSQSTSGDTFDGASDRHPSRISCIHQSRGCGLSSDGSDQQFCSVADMKRRPLRQTIVEFRHSAEHKGQRGIEQYTAPARRAEQTRNGRIVEVTPGVANSKRSARNFPPAYPALFGFARYSGASSLPSGYTVVEEAKTKYFWTMAPRIFQPSYNRLARAASSSR